MGKKLRPTFDQVFRTYVYNKILEIGVKDKNFKIINDSSNYQSNDDIKDFAFVLIKTFGGERTTLKGIEATNLALQIIVDSDNPQKWKMIIDEITEELKGVWTSLSFNETDNYQQLDYSFWTALNTANVIGGETKVGTSSRKIVQANGNIFYTLGRVHLDVDLEIKIDDEYEFVSRVVMANFSTLDQSETFLQKETNILKSYLRGMGRAFDFTLILDEENPTHQKLLKAYFDNDEMGEKFEIKVSVKNIEEEYEYKVYIRNLALRANVGQAGMIDVSFIESGG